MAEENSTITFTVKEYTDRMVRVREIIQAHKLDALLIDQTEFMAYFTGFSVSENMYRACLIPAVGEPVVMFRAIDMGPFREGSWLGAGNAVTFADWEDPIQVLAGIVRQRGWESGRIGIDEASYCMPVARYRQLTNALPNAQFIDVSGQIQLVRTIKSSQEIEYIRHASGLADQAMAELVVRAQGREMSARKAAAIAHQVFMDRGGDTSRAGIITTGRGDDFLHGNLHDANVEDGDILHIELLPFYRGYSARLMRPCIRGEHPERLAQARKLISIQDQQFAQMRPGVKASVVDAVARNGIKDAKLRGEFPNITGYTVGYFPLSTPHTSDFTRVFHPGSDWVLEAGMTFHMYLSASGLAFSETVLVTDTGVELLTRAPRQAHVI